ncbi:MAG TPA: TonB-dependent receptor [Sedimentisphaerales bacterium]|nr:TonB-dependent receptor [Sedimentisphaerales bacterium]
MYSKRKSHLTRYMAVALLTLLLAGQTPAEPIDTASLIDLSLEELMRIPVSGSLTEMDPRRTPVSVTTITAEDIAITPARNLLDLIEIYVPGALWMSHSNGPQLGMRGIIADRNYKYLLLVNGIQINTGVSFGAISELSMWDMSDIEKVEVIRGPGSVTYGPGAIAGVISITTKNARTSPGTEIGAFYWNKYIARGAYIGSGHVGKGNEPDVYGYLSISESLGLSPNLLMTNGTDAFFIGSPRNWRHEAATWMGSWFGDAHVKAHVQADLKNNWKMWARYTEGPVPNNTSTSRTFDLRGWPAITQNMSRINPEDFFGIRERKLTTAAEYTKKLNEDYELEATVSFMSTDTKTINRWIQRSFPDIYRNHQDNLRNIGVWAAENKLFSRLQLNFFPSDELQAALGFEFSRTHIGPGWGRDEDEGFKIYDMVSGPDSEGYPYVTQARYLPLGSGWHANQHAVFGELNFDLNPQLSVILAARMDKHSYTDNMFSPRAAIAYEIKPGQFIKMVAQRSVRMNTEDELFRLHQTGLSVNPETLRTYELMYHVFGENGLTFKTAGFYNDHHVIAWDSTAVRNQPLGRLRTMGLEIEGAYERNNFELGANHSFVQQIDWKLDSGVLNSAISYSDYYHAATRVVSGVTHPVILSSTGNDLNNYANHITKLFGTVRFLDGKLILHGNMKAFWEFPGNKNGFEMLRNAAENNVSNNIPVNLAGIRPLEDLGAFDLMINGNASLTYMLGESSSISVLLQNIPIYGNNKRYIYDTGIRRWEVERIAWIEEPMSIGVRFTARF